MMGVSDRGAVRLSLRNEPIKTDGDIYAFGILTGEIKPVKLLISVVLVEVWRWCAWWR
jgi:hypothetical protein